MDIYGINGAAMSTLLVIVFFTFFKVIYIKCKLKTQPYNLDSLKIIFVIFSLYILIEQVNIFISPIFEILAKSILISLIYLLSIHFLKLSYRTNDVLKSFKKD